MCINNNFNNLIKEWYNGFHNVLEFTDESDLDKIAAQIELGASEPVPAYNYPYY